jgi:hypothetical protein
MLIPNVYKIKYIDITKIDLKENNIFNIYLKYQ